MMEVTGKAMKTRAVDDGGLTHLKGQFEQWRAVRQGGARIPAALWAGAVAAAAEHGAYRVAATLHLDYAVLKRRFALAADSTGTQPALQAAPRFVEFFAPASQAQAAPLQPACVVELANSRGAKMRVELNADALAGLSALCSAFWAA